MYDIRCMFIILPLLIDHLSISEIIKKFVGRLVELSESLFVCLFVCVKA